MNSTDLYEAFRSDVVDTAKPYLWSDDEVWRYANTAYLQFVRFTGGIPDFTSDACSVDITAGAKTSELHPSILRVMRAQLHSDNSEIEIINQSDIGRLYTSDYGRSKAISLTDIQGPVRYMLIGAQRGIVRWINVPLADDVADMVIYRLPFGRITGDGQPLDEVDEMHHHALLLCMKTQAYLKQDSETFDKSKATEADAWFKQYCDQVRAENERYMHKNRVVAYGGL